MKRVLIILLVMCTGMVRAQLNDDFSDGDFTINPAWTGSNAGVDFIVVDNKLRSNSNTANTNFYLSTHNSLSTNTQWEFWANLQFSTSGANYIDAYIMSDKADLKSAFINGYFIRIGITDDEISLYKRSGTAGNIIKLIDGVNGAVTSSNNIIKIRLKRDHTGMFTLEREVVTSGSFYITEGTATDLTHTTSGHFGMLIQQSTSSFFQKHFFDNIKISAIYTDTIPPTISSMSPIDSNTVEVVFSEAMDSVSVKTISNYLLDTGSVQILKIETTSDPAKFHLNLGAALTSGTYSVSVFNVRDKAGNSIDSASSTSFNYIKPYIAKYGDIIINEIFADPIPQVDLPSVEFAELRNNTGKAVSLKSWKIADSGSSATLGEISIEPYSFLIICAKADTLEYKSLGKVLGISPWPSLNNSGDAIKLISPQNLIVDSIRYSDSWYRNSIKKQGGWTLERRDPASKCEALFNWFASVDTTGGTPGKENSVYAAHYDMMPLHVDSLKQLSDTTIKIYFNKHLNSTSLAPGNFTLHPNSPIAKITAADTDMQEITLMYERLEPGLEYQLTISNVADCSGNVVGNEHNKFTFKATKRETEAQEIDTGKVIITEIFVDPSPEIHLPLAEFIEIHNPTKDTIDLDKWAINDPTTKSIIQGQNILPGEYLIFCPMADTVHYKFYGKAIGLNPWPSLNNSSDYIALKSFKNRLVDSIAYSDAWYHNNAKKTGGWSIEKIDLNSVCDAFFNWTASIDSTGGTPGRKNSAYTIAYDLLPLHADSIQLLSDTTVKLYFNKHLNESTLLADNFNLLPGTDSIRKVFANAEAKEVTITYNRKLKPGTEYQMFISKVKDCSGNIITGSALLKFKTAEPPPPALERVDTARIVVTEIFADPSPEVGLPLSEFIEIFNPGVQAIDLNKWTLNDTGTKGSLTNATIAPGEYLILCPAADTLVLKKYGKTVGITPWPVLGNSSDLISLKSFTGRVVDSIAYSDRWYKNQHKKNGGWTLEKIDVLNNSCNGFYNWQASVNMSGGTPGQVNSQYKAAKVVHQISIDSAIYTSDSTITLYLNALADTFYLKSSYFNIDNGIGAAKDISIDDTYTKIHLKFDQKFQEGVKYVITADFLANCLGIKSEPPNNQATFKIPIIPEVDYPILINEIFADPSPSAGLPLAEFIELFNPTNSPVSLKGLSYGDGVHDYKFSSGEISAGGYLILCSEKDTLHFISYGKVIGLGDWPTLANDNDILVLKNNKGREIQKISYNAAWYRDNNKKSGGYSLEIIDPLSVCVGSQNWQASKDSTGGTPGMQNSVYQDFPPEPLRLSGIVESDSVTFLLSFSKTIDSLSASTITSYTINNGVGHPVSVRPLSVNPDQVLLKFKEPPVRGHTYRVEVKDIRDCRGELINSNSIDIILPIKIRHNSVLINEILFNPRPSGVDFIELYNNTKHLLDLKDLSIATVVKDTISNVRPISDQQLFLESGNYILITSDPESIKKEYFVKNPAGIVKASIPPLNDDMGIVVLLSNGVRIDQVSYTEKMHFKLLKTFEGVSLERSNFLLDANSPGNFRSATAASGFATPGYKNSQYSTDTIGNDEFTLVSKTFSPDNDGFEDVLQVNYHMPVPGMIANIKIFDDKGLLVKNLLKNSALNSQGTFSWDGFNEFSAMAGIGIYIIYAEVFDTNGNLKRFRRYFALTTKL